ncbi:hypothetical protein BGZ63DRAFT_401394 [Mariannaea sp. PMI_226]|nr:hypothetical protein BGZ63DRAFT_401394 [Mariannaea sp. PMI_226]
MKILIVGASGMIGGEALIQCLAHPHVSSVTAFVRRDLAPEVSDHPKLKSVVVKDFSIWPDDLLREHADAAAMIWAMGTYTGSLAADLEYPLAFQENMTRVLEARPSGSRPRFRFIQLSGKFVRQDQDKKLWFLEKPRKIKGQLETKTLAREKNHAAVWKSFVVKPGGVVAKTITGGGMVGLLTSMSTIMGENWAIRIDELGAFMTYLAVDGEGEDSIIENARVVNRGRELLEQQKRT